MDLDRDPLGSSKDAMRAIGYWTVDLHAHQLPDSDIRAVRPDYEAARVARAPRRVSTWPGYDADGSARHS